VRWQYAGGHSRSDAGQVNASACKDGCTDTAHMKNTTAHQYHSAMLRSTRYWSALHACRVLLFRKGSYQALHYCNRVPSAWLGVSIHAILLQQRLNHVEENMKHALCVWHATMTQVRLQGQKSGPSGHPAHQKTASGSWVRTAQVMTALSLNLCQV